MKLNPVRFALAAATVISILMSFKASFSRILFQDIFVPRTPREYANIPRASVWEHPLIEVIIIFLAAFAVAWLVGVLLNKLAEKK